MAEQCLPERHAGWSAPKFGEFAGQADVILVGGPSPARLAGAVRLLTCEAQRLPAREGQRLPTHEGQSARQRAGPAARVLVASDDGSTAAVVSVIRSGAMGYVMKSVSARTLLRSVHLLAEGGAAFGAGVAEGLRGGLGMLPELPSRLAFPTLTERERDILELLALGWENKRIARRLVLAEKTVRNHITGLFRKLEVPDRNAAMMRARAAGIGVEQKAAEV
ncbi:response regulator transcription factor [Streptomyces oryzae]|uniref:Response regulator transcription factor n=1 Tax=Streptomyces oryzae TaxID=1434886 RepID=A0ABS3X6Q1_9ACTN|nr:response regulator transcription factor [Streptomyces oryzae]MBO8191059.1 response regulator transcription factor [Streptomyces oryzae]